MNDDELKNTEKLPISPTQTLKNQCIHSQLTHWCACILPVCICVSICISPSLIQYEPYSAWKHGSDIPHAAKTLTLLGSRGQKDGCFAEVETIRVVWICTNVQSTLKFTKKNDVFDALLSILSHSINWHVWSILFIRSRLCCCGWCEYFTSSHLPPLPPMYTLQLTCL